MIDNIIKTERACTGCSACCNICPKSAIKMSLINGFYKPCIDNSKCVSCKRCISVCPQNNEIKQADFQTTAFACKNKNIAVRMKSASGGIFSVLAEKVLSMNGIVYGVSFNDNFMAHHIRIENMSELPKLRRSKYLQSYVGDIFNLVKDDLINGKRVLFSGTPCQCAGLYSYLNHEYDNLLIVEVLCHGTPSPVIWQSYLQYRLKKAKASHKITECMFHAKDTSPKASWSNSYMYIKFDKSEHNVNGNYDPYMMLFARSNVILNDSCYECRYRKLVDRGYVDISICDFWNIDCIAPQLNDDKGVSFLMIHSVKGNNIINACKERMELVYVEPEQGLNYNSSSIQPDKYKDSIKVRSSLINTPEKFGRIYYTYLPVIYIRKVFNKIKKMLKRG